eukprot:CAMPEP_0171116376 /NCGR_PEP_ID=MMETSP0766_2-20121228/90143_1 /TAXON_ID=439317 /ORGANISM="Gambierdiscus australes, Strain CAWD 149" /LENGTH=55 /DNA_ID=CAMNT_0011578809 /DNA_START=3 /DNA_END=170 /DNA_ORIENTATION=-
MTDVPSDEMVRVFLEYSRAEDASRAFSDLNGRTLGGRQLKVRFFDEEHFARTACG